MQQLDAWCGNKNQSTAENKKSAGRYWAAPQLKAHNFDPRILLVLFSICPEHKSADFLHRFGIAGMIVFGSSVALGIAGRTG